MTELEELEKRMLGAVAAQHLQPTLIKLFRISGIDQADFRLWCQLKADAVLKEKLPQMDLPAYLKPFRSQLEPHIRQQVMDSIGNFIDLYLADA